MIVINNNIIPFKGFSAMNLFGIIFARNGKRVTDKLLNHEYIHTLQMKEMLYIGFYIWYLIEWIVRVILITARAEEHSIGAICLKAYETISFEVEAREHSYFAIYAKTRKYYSWIKYL